MLVFGTQIHIVTFIFIVLESVMLFFQFIYYLFRPEDKNRLLYLILLILLLFYNITGGLFPDPEINISISLQQMIAYGSGFLMASYFPFYFYKACELRSLRWHALYGVPLFLMLPYVIFFVIIYAINGNFDADLKYGMIVPFIYALVLLWVIFKAIRKKHETDRNDNQYLEEIAMYLAISPWAALAFFGLVEENQLTEALCTNTGIIAISFLFIWKSIKKARYEYQRLLKLSLEGTSPEIIQENFNRFRLTKMEIQTIELLLKGYSNSEIADRLYISEQTVKKHIYNTFKKVKVKNRSLLAYKLQKVHFNLLLALFL
ncbi:regulatory protein, luxR family [Mucilaginibacter lappiensis]|uniref:DNA-binding CsgD family transcriptional regulator n=1 Tax=Mucilaginibacter lappiensis TaxID=354630 RepID=A0ABR6PHG5_9SPHI|nr:helix-turn-helix transcriptional regulator [Mucilaginibacter lappiensis]MBB6108689.1 DNA-binding CsgD family transcriptional regulator [Mucilaginibacter lappiensis]SIQ27681.1 regulatory protein, luxR family [Mucilaginibacter lappiensis]